MATVDPPVLGAAAGAGAGEEGDAAVAAAAEKPKAGDPDAAHPFFHYYGQLVHQQNMLADAVRTGAYERAITSNPDDFRGKVVLDVGTGSGECAAAAAQAWGCECVWLPELERARVFARRYLGGVCGARRRRARVRRGGVRHGGARNKIARVQWFRR
jgi:hypothetical protein